VQYEFQVKAVQFIAVPWDHSLVQFSLKLTAYTCKTLSQKMYLKHVFWLLNLEEQFNSQKTISGISEQLHHYMSCIFVQLHHYISGIFVQLHHYISGTFVQLHHYISTGPTKVEIILVNNQLDALFSMYLFHFSTCFEQPNAHRQENQLYQYII
jgi:hypothetical protein